MKQGRLPIRTLMIGVGVVAVNLAVLRALSSARRGDYQVGLWTALLVAGLAFWTALQVCGAIALRRRGPDRAYWLGLVAGGAIGALSLIAARSLPGSFLWAAWRSYYLAAERLLFNDRTAALLIGMRGTRWLELIEVLAFTAIEFFPLVLAAWVGGLSARLLHKRLGWATNGARRNWSPGEQN